MAKTLKNDLSILVCVGVEIGKEVFHLVGFDDSGKLVLRQKIKWLSLVATFENLPRCIVGMEACLRAYFVSRTLRKLGFEPRIIPAKYTRPFIKGRKNDYNDAEVIVEAALPPNLKTVAEKTQDQLDLQALHRVRSRLVSRRMATINQIRAFLIEQGRLGATLWSTRPSAGAANEPIMRRARAVRFMWRLCIRMQISSQLIVRE